MLNKLICFVVLIALLLPLAACTTQVSDATIAGSQSDTQPQTTASATVGTTAPTEEVVYVTVPPISVPTESTQPTETQSAETKPTESQPSTEPTSGPQVEAQKPTSYEMYNAMSAEEQAAFYNSFADPNDFFAWMAAAKKEYEESKDQTIVDGNTNIDLGGN